MRSCIRGEDCTSKNKGKIKCVFVCMCVWEGDRGGGGERERNGMKMLICEHDPLFDWIPPSIEIISGWGVRRL